MHLCWPPEKGACENSPKIFEYNNLLCNARVLNSVLELYSLINIFVEYIHLQYTIRTSLCPPTDPHPFGRGSGMGSPITKYIVDVN